MTSLPVATPRTRALVAYGLSTAILAVGITLAARRFLDETVLPAIEHDRQSARGYDRSTASIREGRHRLLADENATRLPLPSRAP